MTYVSAEVRRLVIERAGNCCEYCRLSQDDHLFAFHIEHIIAEKHRGSSNEDNLCLSCPACNGFKGSDIGSLDWDDSGQFVMLYNPRQQIWNEHFLLEESQIEPLTAEGRVTVFLLRFNSPAKIKERQLLLTLGRYPC